MHNPDPITLTKESAPNFKWWAFGAIAVGTFISVVGHGSVLVALPSIAEHFNTDLPTVQWVIIVETLAIAVLLLPMGRLGDQIGRRKVYLVGFSIFILSAAVAGSPWWSNFPTLLIAKLGQGIGSAMLQGNAVAMILSAFTEKERGKALGSNLSVVGLGSIIGPALGGVLVSLWGWKSIFWINIPAGILAIIATIIILKGTNLGITVQSQEKFSFDWVGALLSGLSLFLFLILVGNGHQLGWYSSSVIFGSILFLGSLSLFIWWELRSDDPMLDIRLFKTKLVGLGITAGWISFLGTSATRFMMPFYLQSILDWTPRDMGLLMIPPALCMGVLGPISGRLSDKFGWRKFTIAGLGLSTCSAFILATWLSTDFPVLWIVVMLMMQSAGTGLFHSPNTSSIISAVDRTRYGVIAALTNLMRNSANIVSIAVATTIVVIVMGIQGVEPSLQAVSPDVSDAFISGLRWAFGFLGFLMLLGMAISYIKGDRAPEDTSQKQRITA